MLMLRRRSLSLVSLSLAAAFVSGGCFFVPTAPTEPTESDDAVVVDPTPAPEPEAAPNNVPVVSEARLIGITPAQDFAQSGLVQLALLPKDADGEAVIDAALDVTVASDAGGAASVHDKQAKLPDPDKQLSAALDLDSSGSMAANDPEGLRREAAKQFVDQLDPNDDVAVFDFGAGSTDAFSDTRKLADFGSERAEVYSAIDRVEASGGTPMFQSILEVLDYYEQIYPAGSTNRSLVVLGDGMPTSAGLLPDTCDKAQLTGIPINTIGFGPAADESSEANPGAVKVLRDLADCSGGAYSGVVESTELASAFAHFGEATRSGSVVITVRFDPIPASGDTVSGVLAVGNGEQQPVELSYSFVAP
jgi:hypothetical protein